MWRKATEEWILTELERRGFDVQAACEIIGSSSILVQVAPEFIDELKLCMVRMGKFVEAGRFAEIRQMSHAIRGSAATLCHDELRECLEKMEQICMLADEEAMRANYKRLNNICHKILGEG